MSDRNGKVVEEKVPLRRADTLKKNRWRKSGTGMTSAVGSIYLIVKYTILLNDHD